LELFTSAHLKIISVKEATFIDPGKKNNNIDLNKD